MDPWTREATENLLHAALSADRIDDADAESVRDLLAADRVADALSLLVRSL